MHDRELRWYIKYCSVHPNETFEEMKKALNNELKKPKSQAQSITEVKEIQQKVNDFVWDFDQSLKCLLP